MLTRFGSKLSSTANFGRQASRRLSATPEVEKVIQHSKSQNTKRVLFGAGALTGSIFGFIDGTKKLDSILASQENVLLSQEGKRPTPNDMLFIGLNSVSGAVIGGVAALCWPATIV